MPYIKQDSRIKFGDQLKNLSANINNVGELNFVISKLIAYYWASHLMYQTIAEITGALENVKQEFYRRIASPYEDKKLIENGEVYCL